MRGLSVPAFRGSLEVMLVVAFGVVQPAGAAQAEPGKEYTSSSGGFQVRFPSGPVEEAEKGPTNPARKGPVRRFCVRPEGQWPSAYAVQYLGLSEIDAQRPASLLFDEEREDLLASTNVRLVGERAVELQGHEGRDVTYQDASGQVRGVARFVRVDDRLYCIVAVGDTRALSVKDAGSFIDSFRLLSKEEQARREWPVFDCEEGGFRISMPGAPKHDTIEMGGGDRPYIMHVYGFVDGKTEYFVAVRDVPDDVAAAPLEEYYDGVHAGTLEQANGDPTTLTMRRGIKLGPHPGRESQFKLAGTERWYRAWTFRIGKRCYLLGTIGGAAEVAEGGDRLLQSFSLKDP